MSDACATTWQQLGGRHDLPFFATVELTWACTLRCAHCYLPHHKRADDALSGAEWIRVLDELADLGVLVLTITGGEPTVHPNIRDIVSAAVARRFVVLFKSSGWFANGVTARELADLGVFELHVSVYHHEARAHDDFVGRAGAHGAACAALDAFAQAGKAVRVHTVLMDWNAAAAPDLVRWYARKGWPYTFDLRVDPRTDGDGAPLQYRADAATLAAAAREVPTLRAAAAQVVDTNPAAPVCGIGQNALVVGPTGEVTPCVAASSLSLGNVRAASLRDIWNGSLRRALRDLRWNDAPDCAQCSLRADCRRCPAIAASEHGDWRLPGSGDCYQAAVWRRIREPSS